MEFTSSPPSPSATTQCLLAPSYTRPQAPTKVPSEGTTWIESDHSRPTITNRHSTSSPPIPPTFKAPSSLPDNHQPTPSIRSPSSLHPFLSFSHSRILDLASPLLPPSHRPPAQVASSWLTLISHNNKHFHYPSSTDCFLAFHATLFPRGRHLERNVCLIRVRCPPLQRLD